LFLSLMFSHLKLCIRVLFSPILSIETHSHIFEVKCKKIFSDTLLFYLNFLCCSVAFIMTFIISSVISVVLLLMLSITSVNSPSQVLYIGLYRRRQS
jgi:Na+/phosphate symporter